MNFKECLEKGLLKKNESSKNWVEKEFSISEKFLKSAEKTLEIEEFEISVIAAYDSLFHSARALLFKQGIAEKSHYCLIEALKELYKNDKALIGFLKSIDQVRVSRHRLQYSGDSAGKQEAEFVKELAKDFLKFSKAKK